jgi:hypothetical protein
MMEGFQGMSRADARAVENPITAIFDLAEDVNNEAPRIRKLVTYATAFIGIWLFIDLLLILAFIVDNLVISIFLMVLFILGVFSLSLLRRLNDFFRYYSQRHRVITSLRKEDPVILVPEGKDSVNRLINFLVSRNPGLRESYTLGNASEPRILRGRSGSFYQFDGYISRSPGPVWRSLRLGYPGYQIFIKLFESAPSSDDLNALKAAVEDISAYNRIPPSRVIALWPRSEGEEITEGTYDTLITQVAMLRRGSRTFACSLELIVENEDGTYEFVPYVVDQGYFSASRAQ